MKRRTVVCSCAMILGGWLAMGCEGGGQAGGKTAASTAKQAATAGAKAAATAKTTATATAATKPAGDEPAGDPSGEAKEAPKSPAVDFFTGESPSEVKLITGFVSSYKSFEYAIKTPEGWKGAAQPGWGYMAMRKDNTAALFCDAMSNDESFKLGSIPTFKEIASLAKRAPIMGKDLKEEGEPAVAKIGKLAYPALVGHATGNLFGADGGDLFWIDLRHQQPEGPWHIYCIMAVKKDAGDEVMTQAKAIMRSLEPPRGKKVLEPKMD